MSELKNEKRKEVGDGLEKIKELKDKLKEIKNKNTADLSEEVQASSDESAIYLFFSFDVVNSTKYKNMTNEWTTVITKLLEELIKKVGISEWLSDAELWRVIGDEIIFEKKIRNEKDLINSVSNIFEIMQVVHREIRKEDFYDRISDKKQMKLLSDMDTLSIKGAAWISAINKEKKEIYDSVAYNYVEVTGKSILEFLGSDIDNGFRMKQMTYQRRLALSYELAYLIKVESDNMFIMDYVILKDVWNGKPYPVIWYYDKKLVKDENNDVIPFDESFHYRDCNEVIIRRYLKRQKNKNDLEEDCLVLNPNMYDTLKALKQIKRDNNFSNKLNYLQKIIESKEQRKYEVREERIILQMVVVCVDKDEKIMILKKGENISSHAGKYEFGNVEARLSKGIKETIVKHYREVYGVEISLICETEFYGDLPKTLFMYENEENNNKKGLVLIAEVKEVKSFEKSEKFENREFKTLNEIEKLHDSEGVRDFKSTARRAIEELREWKKKKGELADGGDEKRSFP